MYKVRQVELKTGLSRARIMYYRRTGLIEADTVQIGKRTDYLYSDEAIDKLIWLEKLTSAGISLNLANYTYKDRDKIQGSVDDVIEVLRAISELE